MLIDDKPEHAVFRAHPFDLSRHRMKAVLGRKEAKCFFLGSEEELLEH